MPRLPRIPRAALGPILLASLLVLLLFRHQDGRLPIAPPSAVGFMGGVERRPPPGVATATPAPLSGVTTRLDALDVGSAAGLYDEAEQARLAAELERALDYVSRRFGAGPSGRIRAYVGWEPTCGIHGIAYTSERLTQVFSCPELPLGRAVNIMAHEFVHQLAHDRYGEAHLRADLILLEGVATWGAGGYWLGEAPSFRAFVRPWAQAGTTLPLATSYVGRPVGDMNTLYYQWGSFVEYLVEVYGRERFDALYVSGASGPGSANYQGVYGKPLDELEREWREWLLG